MSGELIGLFDACFANNINEVYRNLFEDERRVHEANEGGNLPLHAAAHGGHVKILELLIRAGAKVDAPGRGRNTSLHFAAKEGRLQCVAKLLAHGADPTLQNALGSSPRDLCLAVAGRSSRSGSGYQDILREVSSDAAEHSGNVEEDRESQAAVDNERAEIIDLLDSWVIEKCTFLQKEEMMNEKLSADKKIDGDDPGKPLVSSTRQQLEFSPNSGCDADGSSAGHHLLEAVKPLIKEASNLRRASSGGGGRLGVFSSRTVARAKEKQAFAAACKSNSFSSNKKVEGAEINDAQDESENNKNGDGDDDGDDDDDEEEVLFEASSPNGQTSTSRLSHASEKKGFYVEIDGMQVFVPEEEEQSKVPASPNEWSSDEDEDVDGQDGEGLQLSYNEEGRRTPIQTIMQAVTTTPLTDEDLSSHQGNSFSVSLAVGGPWGLGMQLQEHGSLTQVSALHPQGPAALSGVKVGDVLINVNGKSTATLLVNQVKALLASEGHLEENIELELKR